MRVNWLIWGFLLLAMTEALLLSCSGTTLEDNRNETLAEIARLEDERSVDLVLTSGWAINPDSLIRRCTARMIGLVDDTLYLPVLHILLADSCRSVLLEALFAAGQAADSALTEALLRFTSIPDSTVRVYAITALSKIGTIPASARMVEIMRDTLEPAWVRAQAAQSLHRLKDEGSLTALIELGRIEDHQIRREIYYSLLRRAAPQMRRLFKIGLRDTLRQIQVYSVIGAGQIGDTTAIDRIAPLLQKPSWRLKYHALNSVAKLKLNPLVKAVSNLLDAKEHVYVRQAAIRTLGELGSSSVSKRLMRFLKDENANLRTVALVALGKIKGQNFLPQVGSFAQSENHCLRIAAAQAYAVIATDDAISKLIAMYADSVAAVRAEVLSHVLATDIDSLVYQFIRYGFTDPDMVPLTLACSKVAEDTNKLLLPEMCAQFWRKKSPYLYEIKTTILDALLEFDDSLEADRQIVEIIDAGLEDKLYAIRKRAAALAQQLSLKYEEKEPHYASEITAGNYGDHFAAYETNPRALIKTNRGTITVELLYFAAPKTALNYIRLASSGFYDNRVWHRVIPDFVIQDGCPRGDGCGGPGYEIRCEYNDRPFGTGSVGMATSGKDTGGSQYFICQSPQPHLDGRYTLFGQVIKGMSVVMKTEVGDSILSVQILPQ